MIEKRTVMDDDGSVRHVLDFEDHEDTDYDLIVLKHDPQDERLIHCVAYIGEEIEFQTTFKRRNLSFDPISVIGRGETDTVEGVSGQEDIDIPDDIAVGLNAVGFAPVPAGEWWIDG